MTLCFFLPTGRTFTFRDAKILVDNETVLQFAYTAMSDGRKKTGVFLKTAIAGWSTAEETA